MERRIRIAPIITRSPETTLLSAHRLDTASEHAGQRIKIRAGNARYSACAVDIEASCGESLHARSARSARPCRRAPRTHWPPTAAGRRARLTNDASTFGHQLPGSLPQRIAEVCPLPTRIALSYLMLWPQRSRAQARLPGDARPHRRPPPRGRDPSIRNRLILITTVHGRDRTIHLNGNRRGAGFAKARHIGGSVRQVGPSVRH